jgi:hypothetical protein
VLSPPSSEFHYSIFFHESSGSDFARVFVRSLAIWSPATSLL